MEKENKNNDAGGEIKNRSEILFLYDAKDCDPNGDPFTGEPRFDEETQKVMVSDVRLKRYIRDYIDLYESDENNDKIENKDKSKVVFYSSLGKTETIGGRRGSLKNIVVNKVDWKDLLKKCIDIRLFGCVLAEESANIDLTGTVQFKNMNRSLNKVILKPLQNTSVIKSKEKNEQGAIATTTQVPYALISAIGYINAKTAEFNKTTEEDIKMLLMALWNQVNTINTRSKVEQTSRLILKINYIDALSKISDIESLIGLKEDKKDEINYRTFSEIEKDLDFSKMLEVLEKK
ncbi:MAG: type I-B CRISPR-associated protein Cas7/Csh2 [Candidatus Altiarchaeales archaeon A3]|nr:MAG: type I-B CRISPR-associated protein Cas7/Csh2 [Candidatus Altiarchaeales archaeon A3]